MNTYTRILVATSCLLTAAVQAETIGSALNNQEIARLIKGNTAEGKKIRDQIGYQFLPVEIPFATYFATDGRLVERDRGGGSGQAVDTTGTWWVKKGKLCFQYPKALRDAGKKCRVVVRVSDGVYELRVVSGKTTHTWDQVVPGNPYRLKP